MKQPLVPKGPDDDFAITRAAMIETLSGYAEKVVRCRSPREVRAFQERIRAQVGARSSTET